MAVTDENCVLHWIVTTPQWKKNDTKVSFAKRKKNHLKSIKPDKIENVYFFH